MSDDIQSSILSVIEAYRRRWAPPQTPPGPLLVPSWFPGAWANAHPDHDLDTICRDYGFDGYQTPSLQNIFTDVDWPDDAGAGYES